MTRFSLRTFARSVARHPNWCLLIVLVVSAIAMALTRYRLKVEMDVAALLPQESRIAQITQSALRDFGSLDFMVAAIESDKPGQEEMLKEAARKLATALDDRGFVRSVTYQITPESLAIGTPEGDARVIALLTEEDWNALEKRLEPAEVEKAVLRLRGLLNGPLSRRQRELLLQDPLNFYEILLERVEIKSGPLKVNLRDNYFMSSDGRMLLMLIWPIKPATDLRFAQEFQTFLEETRKGIMIRNPQWSYVDDRTRGRSLNISYFGAHYETITDSQLVRRDFSRTSLISMGGVLLLFFFAYRRPEALLFVGVPLTIGMLWSLGVASMYPGRLTQVTISFGAILIGLGIDYSIHLYNRYLEETRGGRDNREALQIAMAETGPGTIAGALTTAISFFGMMITRFVGFRELGFVAGLGTICCLLAVGLVLPPLIGYMGRGSVGIFTTRPMSSLGLKRFYYLVVAYPRLTILVSLILCMALGFQAINVKFEDDFRNLKQPSDDYIALRERLESHFEIPGNQLVAIVKGHTLQEALERNDQLFRNIWAAETTIPLIAKDSMRYFLPSDKSQKQSLERLVNRDLDQLQVQLSQAGAAQQLSPRVFEPFMNRLRGFQSASRSALLADRMPMNIEDFTANEYAALNRLAQRYIFKSESGELRIATQIYPPEGEWLSSVPEAFLQSLETGLDEEDEKPEITGTAILQAELRRIIVNDLAITVLIVIVAVFIYLMIYFESLLKTLLALIPVILSLMCMLGVMHLLNMRLHYMNIIALPMIVGIGVDSTIHVLQRYYEDQAMNLRFAMMRTGRAVLITATTTIVGFGSLGFADFRGLRELGFLAVVGVTFTLFAALLFLPAVLRLMERGVAYEGGPGDDLG